MPFYLPYYGEAVNVSALGLYGRRAVFFYAVAAVVFVSVILIIFIKKFKHR